MFWDNLPKPFTGHCHKNYVNTLKIQFLTVTWILPATPGPCPFCLSCYLVSLFLARTCITDPIWCWVVCWWVWWHGRSGWVSAPVVASTGSSPTSPDGGRPGCRLRRTTATRSCSTTLKHPKQPHYSRAGVFFGKQMRINKRPHVKVCVPCYWRCPGTSITLTRSLFLWSSRGNRTVEVEEPSRAP